MTPPVGDGRKPPAVAHKVHWLWTLLARRRICRCGEHYPCGPLRVRGGTLPVGHPDEPSYRTEMLDQLGIADDAERLGINIDRYMR